ncbi:MAG: dTDP-4-dehydrorhamnose reductase [candidate division WOR-3 bacterium]|nr:dTDP-4-dehydrorhamnose reductase [candidate division WOR-3 bacterium]
MRCLVTGAGGLLGTELVEFLRRQNEDVVGWDLPGHDVTDVEKTINGIHQVGPDVVFHLAARTDVDGCEDDVAGATSVNFQGTWAVALGVEELSRKLVYVSTDYVFDGRSGRPYRENDTANPLSVYGRTKLLGENAIRRSCKQHFIVRSSWLYGKHGRNFVDTIRKKSREVPRLEVVSDQVGSPTYARDLCRPLWDLARSKYFGTYHVTNSGQSSWCELASEVVRLTGAQCEVVPIDTATAARRAPRPAYSVLENRNFKHRFGKVLRPWQEALKSYICGNDKVQSQNDK